MELSSNRFKALAVSAGFSFWFFVITSAIGIFSIQELVIFFIAIVFVTQVFSFKLSKSLDIFAIINTKIFLGIFFIVLISLYGIYFRVMRIDLLRLQKQNNTYWLEMEQLKTRNIFKQY